MQSLRVCQSLNITTNRGAQQFAQSGRKRFTRQLLIDRSTTVSKFWICNSLSDRERYTVAELSVRVQSDESPQITKGSNRDWRWRAAGDRRRTVSIYGNPAVQLDRLKTHWTWKSARPCLPGT